MKYFYFKHKGSRSEYHVMANSKRDAVKYVKAHIKAESKKNAIAICNKSTENVNDMARDLYECEMEFFKTLTVVECEEGQVNHTR